MSTVTPPTRLRGQARALALEIAAEARSEWGFATDLVATAFRRHRSLGSGDRRLISETVYGLIRWERRLEAIADELLAHRRGRKEERPAAAGQQLKLLIHELRSGIPAGELQEESRRLLRTDLDLAAAAADEAGLGGRSGLDREAVRLSYPTWLLERFAADLGEAEALALAG